jgi:hypothetical protein
LCTSIFTFLDSRREDKGSGLNDSNHHPRCNTYLFVPVILYIIGLSGWK